MFSSTLYHLITAGGGGAGGPHEHLENPTAVFETGVLCTAEFKHVQSVDMGSCNTGRGGAGRGGGSLRKRYVVVMGTRYTTQTL
jgi:hypothetical protein